MVMIRSGRNTRKELIQKMKRSRGRLPSHITLLTISHHEDVVGKRELEFN
jgi:hypothetical protein